LKKLWIKIWEYIKMKLDFSEIEDTQIGLESKGMLSKAETPEEVSEEIFDRNVIEFIKKNEGLRLTPYRDTVGVLTVGYGHTGTVEGNKKITIERALDMLTEDYTTAKKDAAEIIPDFENLNDSQRVVFIDMAYNLGKDRLSKFKKMRAAIADKDWDRVAIEMKDSKWYRQVGDRSKRSVDIIKQSK